MTIDRSLSPATKLLRRQRLHDTIESPILYRICRGPRFHARILGLLHNLTEKRRVQIPRRSSRRSLRSGRGCRFVIAHFTSPWMLAGDGLGDPWVRSGLGIPATRNPVKMTETTKNRKPTKTHRRRNRRATSSRLWTCSLWLRRFHSVSRGPKLYMTFTIGSMFNSSPRRGHIATTPHSAARTVIPTEMTCQPLVAVVSWKPAPMLDAPIRIAARELDAAVLDEKDVRWRSNSVPSSRSCSLR